MRWYKIEIYDNNNASGKPILAFQSHTSYPRHENPTPLNIQFEYANSINKSGEYARAILLNLFIYSQSIQLFTYLAKLKKKYLLFYAGFDNQAPLSKANGYSDSGNVSKLGSKNKNDGLIFAGEIAGITANFTSMEAWMMLSCSVSTKDSDKLNQKWTLQITEGDRLFSNSYSTGNRVEGKGIANNIYEALKSILSVSERDKLKIYPHKNLNDFEFLDKNTITIEYSNADELIKGLKEKARIQMQLIRENNATVAYVWKVEDSFKYGFGFQVGAEAYNRILYDLDTEANVRMIKEIKEQQKDYNKGQTNKSVESTLIGYNEILEQPQLLGYSDGYLLKTILKPNLQINDLIELKGMTPSMSGLFSSKTGYVGGEINNQQFLEIFESQDKYNKYLTIIGKYRIIGIRHTGNFYGNGINDWTSEMTILPEKA